MNETDFRRARPGGITTGRLPGPKRSRFPLPMFQQSPKAIAGTWVERRGAIAMVATHLSLHRGKPGGSGRRLVSTKTCASHQWLQPQCLNSPALRPRQLICRSPGWCSLARGSLAGVAAPAASIPPPRIKHLGLFVGGGRKVAHFGRKLR